MREQSATQDLKKDHVTIRRVKDIALKCSNLLYAHKDIPIEDMEVISVIIEEFVDHFHHGKEEKAYFPETKEKDHFAEEIRKFLIEHELGRRIAIMLRRELNSWKRKIKEENNEMTNPTKNGSTPIFEPVARFLKAYSVFIDDHTGKEDRFFDSVEVNDTLSPEENEMLMKHYDLCKSQAGGELRIQEMLRLIEYLEGRAWMKQGNEKNLC
ncbi:MAG: hemerythrin domain-containing protein [Thermoproteota archaeon]|nr:hemerythrin domain-containing protein [Thermoproteota archaeon]